MIFEIILFPIKSDQTILFHTTKVGTRNLEIGKLSVFAIPLQSWKTKLPRTLSGLLK